jgi:hypothetical protein
MKIHIVMREGEPVEAWTDKLYAMRRSRELGGPGAGHAIGVVTLELRSESVPDEFAPGEVRGMRDWGGQDENAK